MERTVGDFFVTRHSKRPTAEDRESLEFVGISESGVELARERAREILALLDGAEEGTVMFLGGSSDISRTSSTALVYGKEIRRLLEECGRNDVTVVLPSDISDVSSAVGIMEYLSELAEADPNRKLVIDLPLFTKELSYRGSFQTGDGKATPYWNDWLERTGGDVEDWFNNWNQNSELKGPDPNKVAERQLYGIDRLRRLAGRCLPAGRSLLIGAVGHSLTLDALAVFLANGGNVTVDAFRSLKGDIIGETQMISMTSGQDGKQVFRYGNVEIPLE